MPHAGGGQASTYKYLACSSSATFHFTICPHHTWSEYITIANNTSLKITQKAPLKAQQSMDRRTGALSTAPRPSDSPKSGMHLFDLPQELQDVIFDYAYPPRRKFETTSRSYWEMIETRKRRDIGKSYQLHPFPGPLVSRLLVSKRFFLNAAKAFIGNRVIPRPYLYYNERSSSLRYNIVHRFVKVAVVSIGQVGRLLGRGKIGQPLKTLTITADMSDLDRGGTMFPGDDEFTEQDFRRIAQDYKLKYLVHIQEYYFRFDELRRQDSDTWKLNTQRLAVFVKRYVNEIRTREERMRRETRTFRQVMETKSASGIKPLKIVAEMAMAVIAALKNSVKKAGNQD